MLWDTHMHTHHSGDSDALMPDMIQAAVRQNLDGICFTDHFDYDYPDDPNLFLLDFDSYIKEVRSFQDTCRDRLSIRLGIEVGLPSPASRKSTAKRWFGHRVLRFCHQIPQRCSRNQSLLPIFYEVCCEKLFPRVLKSILDSASFLKTMRIKKRKKKP